MIRKQRPGILVDPAPSASLLAMEILQSHLASVTGVKIDLRTPEEIHPKFRDKCSPKPHRYEQMALPSLAITGVVPECH